MPRKPGRPTKLNDARQQIIVDALREGNYIEVACGLAGIDESTYYRWIERGEQGDSEYSEFRDAANRAIHEAEQRWVTLIEKHAPDNWRAAAWLLERRHSDRWRSRETTEMTGPGNTPLNVQIIHSSNWRNGNTSEQNDIPTESSPTPDTAPDQSE